MFEASNSSVSDYFICVANAETITQVNGTTVAQPIESPSSHDLQIYGIVVTILLCFIVFGGVKMINRVAPAFLIPVFFSLICIYLGILLARKDHPAGLFFALCFSFILCSSTHVDYFPMHFLNW